MKLTNTQTMKRKSGMTLLELTVVILVLLSLISILFIGARAWKKGSDRAANILNIRNVQQAVRAHVNVRGLTTPAAVGGGATLASTEIVGTGKYLNSVTNPVPGTLTYAYLGKVPAIGELYLTVTGDTDNEYSPTAGSTDEW
jgi:prepilin-type N-terminal cleavage/methylation domain-containing protein